MNLFEISSLSLVFFFGLLAIAFSLKEEKTGKLLKVREELQRQRIYQISILKEIQDRIGYSLDLQEVIDVITASLRHLFPYSSVSSIVLKEDKLIFKIYLEESINSTYLRQVKSSMLASIQALVGSIPQNFDEQITGAPMSEENPSFLASFFHIPLLVNNKVVGLINISSTIPNLYKEDEMTILYQITAQASNALSRLQNVLETEKGKLTSMIGSLTDGVFMLDTKMQVLIINDSAKKFLKLYPTAGSGQVPNFFDILNAFPNEFNLVEKIQKAVIQKQTIQEKELTIGDNILQIFITPVLNREDGKVVGVSILLQDVTLEKNLSKIKEDFTNMMVHELRAPLTAIKDSSELIMEGKLKIDERKQLLDIIRNQTKVLLLQVAQVLDAAKIEAGRFSVQKSAGDLTVVINTAVKTFSAQAQRKGIGLCEKLPFLPSVSFDSIYINQVLNNLISNSLKFTPAGGKIEVSGRLTGDFVEISVKDTGIGIPKDKQKDIFSRFYQVQASEHQHGTGLGLYIVKGIIEAHNGSVYLESEEGKGTTITFTLPLNSPQPYFTPNYRTLN